MMLMVLMIVLKVTSIFDDGEDDSDGEDDIDGDGADDDCNVAKRVSHQQHPSGGYQSNGGDTSALDNR